MILNTNTIKAGIKAKFPNVTVLEIVRKKFGMGFVKIEQQLKTKTKFGSIFIETDFDINPKNGLVIGKLEF